jgi:nucleotide-binding universal stress UspA family protein
MFTRILVPTDFSEPSDAALDYAKELAEKFGASLHLVHVIEEPVVTGAFGAEVYVGGDSPRFVAALQADAESRLAVRVTPAERTKLRATTEVLMGPCAPTIVDTAADRGVDLIVMGTHGRTGVAHALMGSVAERVVRMAQCPVLTVHAKPVLVGAVLPVQAGAKPVTIL